MIALGLGLLIMLGGCELLRQNRAPAAAFTILPDGGYSPLEVSLDASASSDPDGDTLTYAWSFGDGTNGDGAQTTHTYGDTGNYSVVLRVIDSEGLDDAAIQTFDVLAVPEGSVILRLGWTWDGLPQQMEFAVSWELYQAYRARLRTPLVDNYEYGAFVEDPLDDPTLEDLADMLWEQSGGDAVSYAEYVLRFVQGSITYTADPPSMEWPRYPLETLVDGEGDCEDTAILFVSLLKAQGIACRLAFVDTDEDAFPDHVLVLVEVPGVSALPPSARLFELDGALYAVAETASGMTGLGIDPWGLEAVDLIELWTF